YWWLRSLPTEQALRHVMRDLCRRYGVDMTAFCGDLCLNWDELAALAADPLVTIAAHTVDHVMLKQGSDEDARREMPMGAGVIAVRGAGPGVARGRRGVGGGAGQARAQPRPHGGGRQVPRRRRGPAGGGGGLRRRRDDAAGRAVPPAPRPPHGAAAHHGQWRV